MIIEKLNREQLEKSLPLVWDVFCKYEAVNYSENGKEAFRSAINSADYLDMLSAYGAFDGEKLVGIIATRSGGTHIALFFVDGAYHRRGIGRSLFEACMADNSSARITVHSSEYAAEVYRRLGFVQTGIMQVDGGIRYIPMVYERKI